MPEIAEVARVVHFLKRHLVGRKILDTLVQEDDIVYGKVGTSASAFKAAMTGKTILDARQQGKYFYLIADSPPHPVLHLGMTGWVKFSNDDSTAYYRPKKDDTDWPPRFWKWIFRTSDPTCEVAFVDARRLARVRLVDCPADQLRQTTPLKENGPDPVVDRDVLTPAWLAAKMRSKRVPVKALLLDQANISGVGNWVADEVLYQARVHPEQYSNTLSDAQVAALHAALVMVCDTAVGVLAESDRFPEDWLMKHRWGKGKKDGGVLPNGEKITFLTVGGRTSAVVLSRQKKAGPVSEAAVKAEAEAEDGANGGVEDAEEAEDAAKPKGRKRKSAAGAVGNGVDGHEGPSPNTSKKRVKAAAVKEEPTPSKGKAKTAKAKTSTSTPVKDEPAGRRRSARLSA